jgi:hypothetical protein
MRAICIDMFPSSVCFFAFTGKMGLGKCWNTVICSRTQIFYCYCPIRACFDDVYVKCLLSTPLQGPSTKPISNSTSTVARRFVAAEMCLPSCYLETDLVYLLISQLLHTNSCTRYSIYSCYYSVGNILFSCLISKTKVMKHLAGVLLSCVWVTLNWFLDNWIYWPLTNHNHK